MTTLRRAAAALLAILGASVPGFVPAGAAVPTMQVVAAAQIATVADRVAHAAVTDPERALARAFTIVDQSVPFGEVTIAAAAAQVNPTYVTVPVAITIGGRVVRTVFAGYRITTYIRTAVAAHDLAPDAIVGPEDLISARVPFAGRTAFDTTTFIGRKVRSVIARGAVLYPELTAVNAIVRAGMPALLIVHDGPVSIAADVVARTSGGLGDLVTTFNPRTQKALSGVVTGPNVVELTLPGAN